MSMMLDPRAFLMNPLLFDPSALALIQAPPAQMSGGGKITSAQNHQSDTANARLVEALKPHGLSSAGGSFRILDLIEPASGATGDHGSLSVSTNATAFQASSTSASSNGSDKGNISGDTSYLSPDGNGQHHRSSEERGGSMSPRSSNATPNGSMNGSTVGSGPSSGGKKARKARTIFTDKQLQELESMFDKQKYLSVQDRMDLAQRMGLTDTQVKTWYQNRRTKWKRQSAVGIDLLHEANNLAAVQNLIRTNPYWAQCMATNPFFAQRLLPTLASANTSAGSLPVASSMPGANSTASPSMLLSAGMCTNNNGAGNMAGAMHGFPFFFGSGMTLPGFVAPQNVAALFGSSDGSPSPVGNGIDANGTKSEAKPTDAAPAETTEERVSKSP